MSEELSDKFVSDTDDLDIAPAPFWMLRQVFSAEELAAKYSAGELNVEQSADFEKHYAIAPSPSSNDHAAPLPAP